MRIRRGLGSRLLPCGCVAGVYETYRDEIVTIIDVSVPICADPAHHTGNVLSGTNDQTQALEANESRRR